MSGPNASIQTAVSSVRYSEYYTGLTGEAKSKYDGKMMISTTIDPYCILEKKSGPSSSCSLTSVEWYEWPEVSFADIYNYLILTPSFCTHEHSLTVGYSPPST